MNFDWIAAFGIGFFGAGHCLSMCGGIASMVNIAAPKNTSQAITIQQTNQASPNTTPIWLKTLCYNLGRLISYALFGAMLGGAFASLASLISVNHGLIWLRLFAACFLILLAFYLGRWWMGLHYVERLGQGIWRFIAPVRAKLLPIDSAPKALGLGFVWGWLPCGLVYSALTWSAASGGMLNGAAIMFAFGLGTLPLMLGVGFGASYIRPILSHGWFRQLSAICILIYALFQLGMGIKMLGL
ncbi:MAG: sulfite exporter TauE/SafE family protein [Vibrio sp.]